MQSLADIVPPECVRHVLLRIYTRSANQWRSQAANMAAILCRLAKHHVQVEPAIQEELEQLRAAINRSIGERRKQNCGLSERIRERLAEFDEPRVRAALWALPQQLYRAADTMRPEAPVRAAALHERGLMLHILLVDPIRRGTLAAIDLQRHVRYDERKRSIGLRIPGAETKNGIEIETPFDAPWAARFARHLRMFRPALRGAEGPFLFPSLDGGARSPEVIARRMAEVCATRSGCSFTRT